MGEVLKETITVLSNGATIREALQFWVKKFQLLERKSKVKTSMMIKKYFSYSGNFAQIRILRMRKCENAKEIFSMRMRCECDDFSKSRCECDANANLSHRIASHSQNAKIAMRIYIPGYAYVSRKGFKYFDAD